ncbi:MULTISPECIES: hypothetical protein [Sphingomonadaceae]|jgi:nickel/cobalt exporter|uniref:High-affinity nickel-transport family protein n=1 Tax=Sphingobium yanoikuyae TaxID=13690 RepID=A0A084EF81_SPHYA|nr:MULTISPECIES: hypothetical protein [Sphingomonadaceae]AYO75520.1 hypothetical protein EBF16_00495 [Sphingobium yanoikuyae]KEZ16623.1 High-affinity nickel-transport family protein [Sphingobium yanoikuyae]MDG2515805.1 hypothetical protein [Sphingobium yanoikuyae]MDG5973224.1 hypothetical protein [Sphingomonas paucimobilis]OJY51808.1 MAG: hypothetical protein BGP17_13230 [Sphingomonas sp. 67-41]
MQTYEPMLKRARGLAIAGTLALLAAAPVVALRFTRARRRRVAAKSEATRAPSSAAHVHRNFYDRGQQSETRAGKWRLIKTGHDLIALEIAETNGVSRFRVWSEQGEPWPASDVSVVTERWDGANETFSFTQQEGYLESAQIVAHPHSFFARLTLTHGERSHVYELAFIEDEGVNDGWSSQGAARRTISAPGEPCQLLRIPGRAS